LLRGNLSLRRFLVLGPVPDESSLLEGLKQDAFRPFEDGVEEERQGWADWRNPLEWPDANWVVQERFAVFSLRIDTRKVPATLLKAHVDKRLQALMKEKDLAFIGKEARISIEDEVKLDLLKKVLPTLKVVEVAWDLKGGVLWSSSNSNKVQGVLMGLFMKSFGCELQPLSPIVLAGRTTPSVATEGLLALDPLDLSMEVSA
ncbi:MAG TPA: recombination-associated protein RdgC, partial [Holophaga sp.]|nr:recombination-associated protein RdgC [Holophaga sp.]